MPDVNRVVVIDRRRGGQGRVVDAGNCEVVLDYQDDGQTLKVFIGDAPRSERLPHSRACGMTEHAHGPRCAVDCPTCGGGMARPAPSGCGS